MKYKILLALLLGTNLYAKLNIIASVAPEQAFIQAIGADKINVSLMVKPGNSPHTYEPKPSQMRDISKADVYMAIGVEFEKVWLPKFSNQNKNMSIVDISKGITKIAISGDTHHDGENLDPHIWTSPANVKILVKNILNALIKLDTSNKDYYTKNYDKFMREIEQTEQKVSKILQNLTKEQRSFVVFHPSWGYFARDYNLTQIPIEVDGKSPKPRALQKLITIVKKLHIHTILTSPEFSDAIAKQLARELHITIQKISPLNPKWSDNMIILSKAISNN